MLAPTTKILVVDDVEIARALIRKYLGDIGLHAVDEAGNGEEAWTQCVAALKAGRPFELILCDWLMPKTKGIHLLNRVRSNSQMKYVPFLMLTAESSEDSVKEAAEAGVSGYLLKPFTLDELKNKLEETFQQNQRARKTSAR